MPVLVFLHGIGKTNKKKHALNKKESVPKSTYYSTEIISKAGSVASIALYKNEAN